MGEDSDLPHLLPKAEARFQTPGRGIAEDCCASALGEDKPDSEVTRGTSTHISAERGHSSEAVEIFYLFSRSYGNSNQ